MQETPEPGAGPQAPLGAPRRPRRRLLRPLAALLGVALVAAGATRLDHDSVAGLLQDVRDAGRTTVAGRSPAQDVAARDRDAGIGRLLAVRAGAVLGHDAVAFMTTVDTSDRAFRDGQRDLFDRLERLPLSEWSSEVAGSVPAARRDPAGDPVWVASTRLSYRLGAGTTVVTRTQQLTVVERPGGWRIVTDADGDTERDLWDLTDISVERGERSLVVAARSQRSHVAAYVRAADAGAVTVDDYLGTGWPRTVVVVAPADAAQMALLLGWDADRLGQIAAVTTGTGSGDASTDRILLNPAAFAAFGLLGRRVVITHETVHVAARARQRVTPALWIEEGYADWVAYQGSGLSQRSVAADALRAVDAGRLPPRLPTEEDFDPAHGDIGIAYGQAWLVMRMIEERYGEAAVTKFYETAAGLGRPLGETVPTAAQSYADAVGDVLGTSEAGLLGLWRDYLEELAE